MKFAALLVTILAVILPLVPTTKLPDRHDHHCPPPPGHEISHVVTDEGIRQFCLHQSYPVEK